MSVCVWSLACFVVFFVLLVIEHAKANEMWCFVSAFACLAQGAPAAPHGNPVPNVEANDMVLWYSIISSTSIWELVKHVLQVRNHMDRRGKNVAAGFLHTCFSTPLFVTSRALAQHFLSWGTKVPFRSLDPQDFFDLSSSFLVWKSYSL